MCNPLHLPSFLLFLPWEPVDTHALNPNCPTCSSINPITGHVEEPMPNPMEEMTEEQKEYEAEKLVTMFDKLSR